MTKTQQTKICKDCTKYRSRDCPRAEYKDNEVNKVACLPTDLACEEFEVQKKKSKTEKKKGNKDANKKHKHYLPFIGLQNGLLAEQGYDRTEVFFLVYDPKNNSVDKRSEIKLEDSIFKPIDNDEVRDGTVLFPSKVMEYDCEEKLMEEISDYLNHWHEPPDSLSRILDVFYCFLTYIYDLIPQLPYRRYLAPWGKGKSAWLETLGWICYRGIVLAGSDTDKSVVRKLNNWRGTALIDEADFGDSSFYAFLIKILNIGYDRKTGFYHRSHEKDPNKTLSYHVYGPKLLATRAKYKDLALESRCLTTIGRQNVNPIPLFRMEKFQQEAQKLRNKLILWRFRNYSRIKETAKQLENSGLAKAVYNGATNISSRVKQVILPLWLIGGDALRGTLTDLAKQFDEHLKIEDPDYLLELQAKDAVQTIMDELETRSVNIGNEVNILYEASQPMIELPLSLISKKILLQQGMNEDDISVSNVTSISKKLKRVFEANLGFTINIGKKRKRIVLIPSEWVDVKIEPPKLSDFLNVRGSHKDVHHVSNVHSETLEPQELIHRLKHRFPLGEFHLEDFWVDWLVKQGVASEQAEAVFNELKGKVLFYGDEGWAIG